MSDLSELAVILERTSGLEVLRGLLQDLNTAAADIVSLLERDEKHEPQEMTAMVGAIVDGIRQGLSALKGDATTINVEPTPIQVNVAAPIINVERADGEKLKFRLSVSRRDELGRLLEMDLTEL